jgi:hypothetical protein
MHWMRSEFCSKNSDAGCISVHNGLCERHPVSKSDKLHHYAAARISSASKCFPGIWGYWLHHLKPSVQILNVRLPGKNIVLKAGPADVLEKVDIPGPLEKYLGRRRDGSFDQVSSGRHVFAPDESQG